MISNCCHRLQNCLLFRSSEQNDESTQWQSSTDSRWRTIELFILDIPLLLISSGIGGFGLVRLVVAVALASPILIIKAVLLITIAILFFAFAMNRTVA